MLTCIEIEVQSCYSEPKIEKPKKPKKKRSKWDLFKFPQRILMLSDPRPPVKHKYIPPPPVPFKKFGPVEPGIDFRSDHLARPFLRKLYENRQLVQKSEFPKLKVNIEKRIIIGWDAIYNYYRKQIRNKKLRRLKRLQEKKAAKKPDKKKEEEIELKRKNHILTLAHPKPVFLPETIERPRKHIEDIMATVDELAHPVFHPLPPPRDISKVRSTALTYEITESVVKLAQQPERMKRQVSEPLLPGNVKPQALKAICTPRVDELAKPSLGRREAKKQEDDKFDPFEISKNALKYKATARIIELSKPIERD